MNQDLEHLRILSVFHYVVGGLAALFSCIPFLHLLIGLGLVTGSFGSGTDPEEALLIGWFLIFLACAFIFAGWTFALGLILAGRFLSQRKHYTFCLVMAGLACFFMPFGTVLGGFTIVVLVRESVKNLFSPARAGAGKTG